MLRLPLLLLELLWTTEGPTENVALTADDGTTLNRIVGQSTDAPKEEGEVVLNWQRPVTLQFPAANSSLT